jgi:L-lysine 2,3-aminomutase
MHKILKPLKIDTKILLIHSKMILMIPENISNNYKELIKIKNNNSKKLNINSMIDSNKKIKELLT